MVVDDDGPIADALVRISLLGGLTAVRADGTSVNHLLWGSGKTRDLMRHLALRNGRFVRTSTLIEDLWPAASEPRARGSLRTSASRIRVTLSANCIVRAPGAMFLTHCWVDVDEFRTISYDVRAAMLRQDLSGAVALAVRAELLYQGDFHAHSDDSDWATSERAALRVTRHDMLSDAASCAVQLHQFREAIGFATLAVGLDHTTQSAQLSLIRAHAELGNIHHSLGVYETYRAHLAEDFGADPSAEAQELHLSVLRGSFD
jgi:two-component SAPR family response regulator